MLKVGLSVIDESDVDNYKSAFDLLLSLDETPILKKTALVFIYQADFSVMETFALLLKKINSHDKLPTHFLFLYYGSFIFQILLPLHKDDLPLYEEDKIPLAPPPPLYFFNPPSQKVFGKMEDMSNTIANENDTNILSWKFDNDAFANLAVYDPVTKEITPLSN